MSVLIKYMAMPKGCIYANDKDQTEYCPLLNHDDVPFCQYIENEPESAIGIDERPVYCPLSDVPEPCQDTINRQQAIEAICTWDKFGVDERGRVVPWYEGLEPYVHLRDVVLAIENLTSAQPNVPDTSVGDMISRYDVIELVKNSYYDLAESIEDTWAMVADVEKLPSAQPERKKGKWLPDNNNYYEERYICSVCVRSYKVDTCMGKPMWDFCPSCGADMRGEQE